MALKPPRLHDAEVNKPNIPHRNPKRQRSKPNITIATRSVSEANAKLTFFRIVTRSVSEAKSLISI